MTFIITLKDNLFLLSLHVLVTILKCMWLICLTFLKVDLIICKELFKSRILSLVYFNTKCISNVIFFVCFWIFLTIKVKKINYKDMKMKMEKVHYWLIIYFYLSVFLILMNVSKKKELISFDPFLKNMKIHLSISLELNVSIF